MKTKGKNITVHFSDETYTKLSMLAKQQERSKGFFIKKAIDAFLRDRKEDDEDYRIAIDVLSQNNTCISLEEYEKKHNLR